MTETPPYDSDKTADVVEGPIAEHVLTSVEPDSAEGERALSANAATVKAAVDAVLGTGGHT